MKINPVTTILPEVLQRKENVWALGCRKTIMNTSERLYSFQPCVAFHIETSHLICANQMAGFCMKYTALG